MMDAIPNLQERSSGAYSTLSKLFRWLMAVFILMLVLLPSGSIFGINVKLIWFFLLAPLSLRAFFVQRQATRFRLLLVCVIPGALLCWVLLSQVYGFEPSNALFQYKDLMTTILTCWFAALFCAEGQSETIFFIRAVVLSEVATSFLKVLLLTYSFARGVPVTDVVNWIKQIFGVSLMTMDFESMLGRIQFISDGLIPVCIFAVLRYRRELRFNAAGAVAMLLLLLTSDVFSFSRYFWGYTVLAVVLGLLFGRKDLFQVSLITILSGVILVSLPLLTSVIELRFSTTLAGDSDQARTVQVEALDDFFSNSPTLGHGLGSYTTRVIRNDDAPYTYEDQLLALTAQVGVVGMVLLSALTLYYFRDLWPDHKRSWMQSLALPMMLTGWICAGLFNPEIISSAASVSYAAIAAMAGLQRAQTHVSSQI